MLRLMTLVALLIGASTANLLAQTPDTATVHGTVVDSSYAAIVDATVVTTSVQNGMSRKVKTDNSGHFAVVGLKGTDSYDLTVSKDGFAPSHIKGIKLVAGSSANLELHLSVAGLSTEVTVQGAFGQVRIDQPQIGDTLSIEQIQHTPLLGNKITYLPLLNAANRPAINQGDIFMNQNLFTTNGSGRRQQYFIIDGVSGNDSWGRQTIFTSLPRDSVAEMSVLTNSFSAEYGASTGALINITTKAGGTRFHGYATQLWRPSAAEAGLAGYTEGTAPAGNAVTNDTVQQTDLAISGALPTKTYMFIGSELSREFRASPVNTAIETLNYIGNYREWLGYLRLDRELTAKTSVFYRFNLDAYKDTNPNGIVGGASLPTVARVFHKRTYANVLGITTVLGSSLVNNGRLQFQLGSPITEFAPVINSTQVVVPIVNGGSTASFTSGTSQSALLMNRQYQFTNTVSVTKSRHQLSVGADVLYAHSGGDSKEFGGPLYLGRLTFNTCTVSATQTLADCESRWTTDIANLQSYSQSFGNASYVVDDVLWAAFVQDDVRLNHLTLNLGLRYERQTFTDSNLLFAPRIGFVYNPRDTGSFLVRGGFGIYDSQVVNNAQANYALTGPTGVFNFTATAGQIGFPTSLSGLPLASFPMAGAVPLRSVYIRPGSGASLNSFFPTSTLVGYPDKLLNPYSEQYTLGVDMQLSQAWTLAADFVGTHTLHITRPLDVDAPISFMRTAQGQSRSAQAANCTRPYWVYWYSTHGTTCTSANTGAPPYSVILTDVANGQLYYDALDLNLNRRFSNGFSMLASYTYSHTIDNVDPDTTSQNPNDALLTGSQEIGNAIFDQRHRFVLSGEYVGPLEIHMGGVVSLASGLPYNFTTGVNNSGNTGATTDRPVIDGVVVRRNTGRGRSIYELEPFVSRSFSLFQDRVRLEGRAEAYNILNHANFIGYNGVYGNSAVPSPTLGVPLLGITNQLPARSVQFQVKASF
jgi:hypothetical protein